MSTRSVARELAKRSKPNERSGRNGRTAGEGAVRATHALKAATGITDERLLRQLRELGFSAETVRLLHFVPLVQVAWSAGGISRRERKLITDLAELRGIRYGSEAFEQLREWLSERPPVRLFDGALSVIRASLDLAPSRLAEQTRRTLVFHCTQVAVASREESSGPGTISDPEHAALEAIVAALEEAPFGRLGAD